MKKFLLLPLLALPLNFFLIGSETGPEIKHAEKPLSTSPRLKMIEEVLADYHAGCYHSFLKRSDEKFQRAEKEWKHTLFLEERKKISQIKCDHRLNKSSEFKQKFAALQEAQDQELLEVALNHPNEKMSREVRDMIFFSPSKEEEKSLQFIHELSLKSKGDGHCPIENKLIAIDTEFWIKTLSLEIAKTKDKIDHETFQKQLFVLHLEKIKQMKKVCEEDESDRKITSYVETASAILPKVYASAATRKHLNALGSGKISPQNPLEEKFQSIVIKYLQKEADLVEKCFPKRTR